MKPTSASNRQRVQGGALGKLLAVILPVIVLAGGVLLAVTLIETSPKAELKPPPRLARLVEVREVHYGSHPTVVRAHGTVQPAREVTIYPRVSGEVLSINEELIPGGRFEVGEELVTIDPRDYELTVRERETELARAKANLAMEMGQQSVAQREFELLGENVSDENRDLVLRKPQLAQVQATLQAAEAALDLAKLNLERTTVRAPFNCTVRMRNVNVGMQVNANTPLATVTGSDEYWVELTVPVNELRWVQIPAGDTLQGSTVYLTSESSRSVGTVREGTVIRLLPDLEPEGRLARVLVSVKDPLALLPENQGKPALILGDYVRAEIDGVGVPRAVALERRLFRDGDQVWIMTPEAKLEIRPVTVTFRGRDKLLVTSGLEDGERVILTDLPAAVEGMALRTAEESSFPTNQPPETPGNGANHT